MHHSCYKMSFDFSFARLAVLLCTQCCQFLWIVHSWLPLRYSLTFIRARVAQWVRYLDYLTTHTSLSPKRRWFAPGFVNYKTGALDSQAQVDQLLAHGRWFSPGTPTSSTTKTRRHDIAEILLNVALNTKNHIKSINLMFICFIYFY